MNRPLTRAEESQQNRFDCYAERVRSAREKRGEKGAMEEWLAISRILIKRDTTNVNDTARQEVFRGFNLVIRLFMLALEKRAEGDRGLWHDLLGYAQKVLDADAKRHQA